MEIHLRHLKKIEKKLRHLQKAATLQHTLLLGLLLLVMGCFIMPEAAQQIKQYAHDTDLIDTKLIYSPSTLYEMMKAYGQRGRSLYIVVELTADFVFSIVVAAFFSSLLVWSSKKINCNPIKLQHILWLPVTAMLLDWLENSSIIWMLANFPEKYDFLASMASIFTFLKWLFIGAAICVCGLNLARLSFSKFELSGKTKAESSVADNN